MNKNAKGIKKRKRSALLSTYNSPTNPPEKSSSPRCVINGEISIETGFRVFEDDVQLSPELSMNESVDQVSTIPKWNPKDPTQLKAAKMVLHVATVPANVVCREAEQKRVLEICKDCIEREKASSIYVCGCPGTGKTLSIKKVKEQLSSWSKEVRLQPLESLEINCTSLTTTSEIFSRILENLRFSKKRNECLTPLQHLQNLFSQRSSISGRMLLAIIDEMDYLITKDRAVLQDLFMLTTLPFSCLVLIGIANAIDLADRFLPRLKSMNCMPFVVTYSAYSRDQILKILQERLAVLGYNVFQPSALEYCIRKVVAASGDMRKVLDACRTSIEVLEAELSKNITEEQTISVTFDHMDAALSKAFKSPKLDVIHSLPQHQQIILCSMVKLFHSSKKNATTVGELNKSYLEACKFTHVPTVGSLEFRDMCKVLSDQGLIKLGQSKEDKLKRITLQIDISDISYAFKDIRFFKAFFEG